MTKREIVLQEIKKGGATMESLQEAADCKYESVMSIFSTLRLMGQCPFKNEDGTYSIISSEEWEEYKASRASSAKKKAKTPEEELEAAQKALDRAQKSCDLAKARTEKDPEDNVLDLRFQKAQLELRLAEIRLEEAEAAIEAE